MRMKHFLKIDIWPKPRCERCYLSEKFWVNKSRRWAFVSLSRRFTKKLCSYEGKPSTVFVVNGNKDLKVTSLTWERGSMANDVNLSLSSRGMSLLSKIVDT